MPLLVINEAPRRSRLATSPMIGTGVLWIPWIYHSIPAVPAAPRDWSANCDSNVPARPLRMMTVSPPDCPRHGRTPATR